MIRNQWTVASRVRAGDAVRLPDGSTFQEVVRVTGSPGRRSPDKAPLLRFFVDDEEYLTIRTDAAVQIRRRPARSSAPIEPVLD